MSGGPIVDVNGHAFGVISTGYDTGDAAIGYGACIASIAELTIGLHTDDGEMRKFPVSDLLVGNVIRNSGHTVTLAPDTDDGGLELRWGDTS